MSVVKKHKFEAVSLLTTQSGFLDVTVVPVVGQPDWLLPSTLILDVQPSNERIWNYLWRKQDVAVYHLLPRTYTPTQILVVEGNTDVHRLALQISGELYKRKLKISQLRDAPLPENFAEITKEDSMTSPQRAKLGSDFVYQAVNLEGDLYIIPDIDTISHQLVDLDDF